MSTSSADSEHHDASGSAGGVVRGTQGPVTAGRVEKPNVSARPSATTGLVRAGGRPSDVVAFEESLVAFFVDAADLLGVPKSVAAIYAICFASAEPLSFSQINDRLEISSGSISQGLRVLREVGALRVAAEPGARAAHRSSASADREALSRDTRTAAAATRARERFEPDLELRKLVLHWIEKRLQTQLASGTQRLEAIVASIPALPDASTTALRERLGSLQSWHDKSRALLPVAKTFLKLT